MQVTCNHSAGNTCCVLRCARRSRCGPVIRDARVVVAALLLCLLPGTSATPVRQVRRVLIFYELGLSSPAVSLLDQEIRTALENSPFQIELYREYLDTTLFPDPATQKEFGDWYIHKYRDRKPDLIITLGPSPLRYILGVHERAFGDIPIVFGGTSEQQIGYLKLDQHFTGVWEKFEPVKTLDVALGIQPGTKHVVVVGGTSSYDRSLEAIFRESLHPYEERLDITYDTDLDMPTLLERLKALPPKTIVLYSNFERDAAGTPFIAASQADPMIASAANAPIFTPTDVDWGHGEVGGDVQSFDAEGKLIGTITQAILNGKKPEDIPVVRGANVYMFDWRALKRWGLSEKNLPAGSIVLNRPPSFWEVYKRYILAGIFVLLAQSFAIFALLWQRSRRRRTETELRKSEEKFSKAFRRSPLAFILANIADDRFVEVNDTFEYCTGWRRQEVIGRTPLELNFWADAGQRSTFIRQLQAHGAVRGMESLFHKKDGQSWTGLVSAELINLNGEPCALSLIADITEVKRAELARRESEARFRLVANTAPVMIWMSGPDKLCTYFNRPWLDFTGRAVEAEMGNGWAEGVHQDDLRVCLDTYNESFDRRERFEMEYRLRRHDGEYRWILDIGVPRFNQDQSFAGYIGSAVDVTDRKMAEVALSDMARKLIEAQEQERARIGRELHDDINQRIAMLAIELEQLQQDPAELQRRTQELRKQAAEIGEDVQALSHELHSTKLEYLGVVAGIRSWCKDFSERQRMEIDFSSDVRTSRPLEIGVSLFRVLQESLHNAVKHSGVKAVKVGLREQPNEIQLTIRDSGIGFDIERALQGNGLGLTSMRERIRLVNGTILISSKPMGGTTISVRVPLKSDAVSNQAVG